MFITYTSEMEEKKEFSINLKPEVATGKYTNLAVITHSRNEFIIDFATVLPGIAQPEVVSRVIMNPDNAKKLLAALQDNIRKFEEQSFPIQGNGTRS